MRRLILVVTVAAVMAAVLMALSGAALAQDRGGADVCVSNEGETIYDSGPSTCFSDPTSQAVAVNGSDAFADSGGEAVAVNNSGAFSDYGGGKALAANHSLAIAFDSCSATALNGEVESCP